LSLDDFAHDFWLKRQASEKHRLEKYFVLSPKVQLIQVVSTGFIRNTYYMRKEEIFNYSHAVHKKVAEEDTTFHFEVLKAFRQISHIKDQIILGLAVRNALEVREVWQDDQDLELLGTFPPHLLLRYADVLRKLKPLLGRGFGSRPKRLIRMVMAFWSNELFEQYAIRYTNALRDLIRLIHPKFLGVRKKIAGWIVANPKRRKAPTDRLMQYDKMLSLPPEKRIDLAVALRLPFNALRSLVPISALQEIPRKDVEWLLENVMTPSSVVFNFRYLYKLFGDEIPLDLINKIKYGRVSLFDIARAFIAILDSMPKTAGHIAEIFESKAGEIYKELLPGLKAPKLILVLDVSGSMFAHFGSDFVTNTLTMASPLRKLAKKLIVFSDEPHVRELNDLELNEIEDTYKFYRVEYSGGTNIASALEEAFKHAEEGDVILLFSDEQENACHEGEQAIDKIRKRKDVKVIVINPSPYPSHAVDTKRVIYIPALTPESIKATLRLLQLLGMSEKEAIEYIRKLIKVGSHETDQEE